MHRPKVKGIAAQAPYTGFTVYKVFHRKTGRYYACLRSAGRDKTIAWAKYVYETSTGQLVPPGLTVDHVDEDKTNDAFTNLQLLTSLANTPKHAAARASVTRVQFVCPCCAKPFSVGAGTVRFFPKRRFHCSHRCAGTMQHRNKAA